MRLAWLVAAHLSYCAEHRSMNRCIDRLADNRLNKALLICIITRWEHWNMSPQNTRPYTCQRETRHIWLVCVKFDVHLHLVTLSGKVEYLEPSCRSTRKTIKPLFTISKANDALAVKQEPFMGLDFLFVMLRAKISPNAEAPANNKSDIHNQRGEFQW